MNRGPVVDETVVFPIKPTDINIDPEKGFQHLFDAFDNSETEVSAFYVLKLMQRKGSWYAFTAEEVQKIYKQKGHGDDFWFNRLIVSDSVYNIQTGGYDEKGGGWIVKDEDGKLRVTADFILRCYRSSPAELPKVAA